MNNKKNHYEQNKQKLKEYAQNHYHSKNGKAKSEYHENNKERLYKEIVIEIFLKKKKTKKENVEKE